jgi:hypothetical protein
VIALTESPQTCAIDRRHGYDRAQVDARLCTRSQDQYSNRETVKLYHLHHPPQVGENSPQIQTVFSTILQVSSQLIPLVVSQDQKKATSQNNCDASHHRNTLLSVVNAPYTTCQYFSFAILLSFLLSSMCHENIQEWVNH